MLKSGKGSWKGAEDSGSFFEFPVSGGGMGLEYLDEAIALSALVIAACLAGMKKRQAGLFQELAGKWLADGIPCDDALLFWMDRNLKDLPGYPHAGRFGRFRSEAARMLDSGLRVCRPAPSEKTRGLPFGCPALLFQKGALDPKLSRLAVFNSRTPKKLSPRDAWIGSLRALLPSVRSNGLGILSSVDTSTYDFVSAFAARTGTPLALVLPFGIGAHPPNAGLLDELPRDVPVFSCAAGALVCTKKEKPVCRDRLLAHLSQAHLVLDIRRGGNLHGVLERQQRSDPRPQVVVAPRVRSRMNEGGFLLLESFPRFSRGVAPPADAVSVGPARDTGPARPANPGAGFPIHAPLSSWERRPRRDFFLEPAGRYLYHYTRSFAGPWPGQRRLDYFFDLLDDAPRAGHSALDTLIRILLEARIRAGARLVRGTEPVISWSAKSPLELESIRKWNPALIRWTFEPFGIAVGKSVLRQCGARPAVYAKPDDFNRLKPSERYRFQRHEPPKTAWKQEREWRLRGDLPLDRLQPGDAFVFVPGAQEREQLLRTSRCPFPVVTIEEMHGEQVNR